MCFHRFLKSALSNRASLAMRNEFRTPSMIILQRPGEEDGGFGVGLPVGEGVLEAGEVLEEGDEGFALGPVVFDFGFEPGAAGFGSLVGLGDFADGEEGMAEEAFGEGVLACAEEFAAELGGGHEADFVGFVAGEEGGVVADAEAAGEFLVSSGAEFTAAFEVEAFEVETLGGAEGFPERAVDAGGDEVIAGDFDGFGDGGFERGALGAFAFGGFGAGQFAGDIDVLDGAVAGEHAKGGGVGGELVIGVGEVRGVGMGIVQLVHGIELPLHLCFHLGIDFIEEGGVLAGLLAEDEKDGALDVDAGFEGAVCLGSDAPG